jgi:sulfoxide reductase heme-binding subunit YedZ
MNDASISQRERQSRAMRRVRRHLALFIIAAALTGSMFAAVKSDQATFRISMATAYSSMTLLVATLLIGPLNVLRDRPNPMSTKFRRDIGIWGAILGLLHVVAGLQVHLPGKMVQYFIDPRTRWPALPIRLGAFGSANYAGAIAGLILVLLLALSNDASLRKLRSARWKYLQRANYIGMALIVAHGVAYQVTERRQVVFVLIFALMALVGVAWQIAGYRKTRADATRQPAPQG